MPTFDAIGICRSTLATLVELLQALPGDPAELAGRDAARLAAELARGEHACAAVRQLCARRVASTAHYESEGYRDAAEWLGVVAGGGYHAARNDLESAAALETAPATLTAFVSGDLSPAQAREVARAVKEDPSAEHSLLSIARRGSLTELRTEASRVRAAARSTESDERRHDRVRSRRCLSSWRGEDGEVVGRFSLAPEDGAVVIGRLGKIADRLFEENRAKQGRDSRSALMADALVALASGEDVAFPDAEENRAGEAGAGADLADDSASGTTSRRLRPDYLVVMRVDLEALVRGSLRPGEESTMDGVGPIPISLVQSYLDQAKVRLVVESGADIRSVFSFKRTIPVALRTALEHRDRTCVVPGCTSSFRLEIDHIIEVERGGPTSLDNTCRLCRHHHDMKTNDGWRVEGGPGTWRFVPPVAVDVAKRRSRPSARVVVRK